MEIRKKKVKDLKCAPYNPRIMDENELFKLKRSISEFGYVEPIVWNRRTGLVVGGNQRLKVLQELGVEEVDVVVVDLDARKEKALNVALNKISGEWDFPKLKELLVDLDTGDFDIELTGFDIDEINDLITYEKEEIPAPELNEEAEKLLDEAWRELAARTIEEFDLLGGFSFINRPNAKVKFLEALYYGKPYPRHMSHAYHPQQFLTNGHTYSVYDGLKKVVEGTVKASDLRFVTDGDIKRVILQLFPFAGAMGAHDFPAELARDLINEFARGGKVLDPCHGWGGRLVGFLLSNASEYLGIDASPLQTAGVEKIREDFLPYVPGKQVHLVTSPFEDYTVEGKFDFAITSPPYFNKEKYLDGEQSHLRYPRFKNWRDGFYAPLISKVYDALNENSVFALQVGSQKFPLLEEGKKIAQEVGFSVEEVRDAGMHNDFHKTPFEQGEVIIILRKTG